MKLKIYTKKYAVIIAVVGLAGVISAFRGIYPGGSPGGYSGSPLDNKNCTFCHNGTALNQAGIITSNVDTSGYIPGNTYTITVTVSGSGSKGFEVSPLNTSNTFCGTLIAGTSTKLVNGSKAVTQSVTSGANPSSWNFQWTAPAAGTGRVTFYGAFTQGKSNTKLSTLVLKEKLPSGIDETNFKELALSPNPASTSFNISFNCVRKVTLHISLVSVDGKRVYRLKSATLDAGLYDYQFQTTTYPRGNYMVNFQADGQTIIKKLVLR